MKDFGVVYILTKEDKWKAIQEFSQSTLPLGTPVEVIEASDFGDCFFKRLDLVNHLPFKRTLYLDCDMVYCCNEFPDWVFDKSLRHGLGCSGWSVANQVWNTSIGFQDQFEDVYALANLPIHFLWVNTGLMLIESHSSWIFTRWLNHWEPWKLLEPAFIKAFWHDDKQPIDWLPSDFHIPSWSLDNPYAVRLKRYYFIHAIGDDKLRRMQALRGGDTINA